MDVFVNLFLRFVRFSAGLLDRSYEFDFFPSPYTMELKIVFFPVIPHERRVADMPWTLRKSTPAGNPPVAGNTATGVLKWIALLFMFIDHSGKVIFNNNQDLRLLGRIAFPIYIWCMVVGLERTRSVPRYLLRILLVGFFSQPLYVLALDNQGHLGVLLTSLLAPLAEGFSLNGLWLVIKAFFFTKPNIFLTLFVGLAALWGIREKKWFSHIWAPVAAVLLATVLNVDYGWKGIILIIMMYAARHSRPALAAVMIAFFMYWGTAYRLTNSLWGISFDVTRLPDWLSGPLSAFLRLETYALLSLPFILCRFPKDLRMPKWVSYALYPGHLVLLILLKLAIFR